MSTTTEEGAVAEVAAPSIVKGEGTADTVTPSGLKIHFESKPRRHYVITPPEGEPVEAISVTTALDVLYKGGLDYWGMRVGIDGYSELIARGLVRLAPDAEGNLKPVVQVNGAWEWVDRPGVVGDEVVNIEVLLKELSLRVDKIKDATAVRGDNVHNALEVWAAIGKMPVPEEFPIEQQGYVQALLQFLLDSKITPRHSEVLVGSYEHKYAGRFDLECNSPYDTKVVTKVFPKSAPKHVQLPIGIGRLDLKTSKDVYFNTLLQLMGYEGACVECGYGPSDWQGTLNVQKDGRYQLRINPSDHRRVTHEDFLAVLETQKVAARALEAIKV